MIKDLINKLVKKYKTTDPFQLCDYLNIDLRYANLGNSIRGMYSIKRRNKFITLNSNYAFDEDEATFVLAHEIGHVLLHGKENKIMMDVSPLNIIYKTHIYEQEADCFALSLLQENNDLNYLCKISKLPLEYVLDVIKKG